MNSNIPTDRYSALSNLEELRLEKLKLRLKVKKHEQKVKEEIEEMTELFRFWSSIASAVKGFMSYIPILKSIPTILKFIKFFRKT